MRESEQKRDWGRRLRDGELLGRVAEAHGGLMHQHQSGLPVQLLHSTHWPPPLGVRWHSHTDHGDKTHSRARASERERVTATRVEGAECAHPARERRILHSSAFNWTDINLKK